MALSRGKRLGYIDIAKGIAILCIVFGHMNIAAVNRVVFTFHVPLFYLITGYFTDADTNWRPFLRKKLRTLIVPYYLTCLAIILLAWLKSLLLPGGESTGDTVLHWIYASLYGLGFTTYKPFPIYPIGAIWFLWATFWGSLLLRCLLGRTPLFRLAAVLLLGLFGCLSGKVIWLPLSFQPGCCALLYMYLGHLWRRSQNAKQQLSPEVRTAGCVFAAIVWLFFIRDFQTFWLVSCDFGRGAVDFFGSVCACIVVFQISRIIEKKLPRLTRWLSYLGRYSLILLCVHIIELNLFPWDIFWDVFTAHGVPPNATLLCSIATKFLILLPLTVLLSRWNPTRILFGFPKTDPAASV